MGKKDVDNLRGVVFCCHGSACTRAQSRTVEKALRLHARELGPKSQVRFVRTACTGLCKSAPVVIICANPPQEAADSAASTCGARWKLEVRAEQAPALMDEHFSGARDAAAGQARATGEKKRKKAKGKKS